MNDGQNKKQKLLRYTIFSFVGILFTVISSTIVFDYLETQDTTRRVFNPKTNLPMDNIDPKEIWVDQMRSENSQIRNENELVQGKVNFIQDIVVKRAKEDSERETVTQNEISELRSSLESLKTELKNSALKENTSDYLKEELRTAAIVHRQGDFQDPFSNSPIEDNTHVHFISQEVFTPLTSVVCPEPINLHHVDRTIPTGTTVKAILLSSVDMPCGVKGSVDPLPVKLRVIADGRLPHQVRARLKSGIITACVYGDLSSERVYFRLEKLTQVRADGHYIETQIAGYVSGEDGKYGLRGVVVDKSSQLVENALLSGFLSGASNFFEAAAMAKLSPLAGYGPGVVNGQDPSWSQSAGQIAIAGGSGGVTNALDALTDYFIKRAEQLRPVIQITPGRLVDITFSDCADLGDLYTHERVRNISVRESTVRESTWGL